MAKFRIMATYYTDLSLDVEARDEEEAIKKAKEQVPSVREATYLPWTMAYENFDIGETEVEEVDDDGGGNDETVGVHEGS
jgi:hypothetical protein